MSVLGLHNIGKNCHCNILVFCDIYCSMKKIQDYSADNLNSSIESMLVMSQYSEIDMVTTP